MQVVCQGAGPGKQPPESVRGAQAHRQSGGLSIQAEQDASLGTAAHSKP